MSISFDALAASIALIAVVILSVFCASLARRQSRHRRRLADMQTEVGFLIGAVHRLERDYSDLRLGLINSSKSSKSARPRKTPKSSTPPPDAPEEKTTSSVDPTQPDEKSSEGSTLYVVASKTSSG